MSTNFVIGNSSTNAYITGTNCYASGNCFQYSIICSSNINVSRIINGTTFAFVSFSFFIFINNSFSAIATFINRNIAIGCTTLLISRSNYTCSNSIIFAFIIRNNIYVATGKMSATHIRTSKIVQIINSNRCTSSHIAFTNTYLTSNINQAGFSFCIHAGCACIYSSIFNFCNGIVVQFQGATRTSSYRTLSTSTNCSTCSYTNHQSIRFCFDISIARSSDGTTFNSSIKAVINFVSRNRSTCSNRSRSITSVQY